MDKKYAVTARNGRGQIETINVEARNAEEAAEVAFPFAPIYLIGVYNDNGLSVFGIGIQEGLEIAETDERMSVWCLG